MASPNNPFNTANPFGTASMVETSYQPPAGVGAWQRTDEVPLTSAEEEEEDYGDEPFTAAHLAAANQAAVPAVAPAAAAAAAPLPPQPQHTTLTFTESTQPPPRDLTGRIGQPVAGGPDSPVPRLGSAANTSLLAGSHPSSSSLQQPAGLPANGGEPEDPSKYPFYSIKRYRTYFNVDTMDVLHRIFCSIVLFFRGDFLERIAPNPDLYGPFWVATTLIFVSAATGNFASYIQYKHEHAGDTGDTPVQGWYYDVDKVGGSFGLFYGYVGVVGLALYFLLRWFQAGVSLASVWCTYGYALAIFIPVSCVCVIPVETVRWSVIGTATGISAIFILLSFRKPIHDSAGAKALPLLLVLLALHLGLGAALKLYFFRYASIKT